MSGCAAHAYADFPEDAQGYCNLALLLRGYSAVTGACLAVRKAVYEAVGGLDEAALPVGYNDIDFCLKLRARGLRNLWTPRALLFHHESRSRGADSTPEKKARFWNEMSLLKKRWPNAWYHDPAYNPNLTLSKVDYDRSMQPRTLLNTRHWPSPFAAGYVAPKSSGLRLLLALPAKGPDSRPLAFARALLRQGLIQSYLTRFDRAAIHPFWGKPIAIGLIILGLIGSMIVAAPIMGLSALIPPLLGGLVEKLAGRREIGRALCRERV